MQKPDHDCLKYIDLTVSALISTSNVSKCFGRDNEKNQNPA
jgi:hypothetical protein